MIMNKSKLELPDNAQFRKTAPSLYANSTLKNHLKKLMGEFEDGLYFLNLDEHSELLEVEPEYSNIKEFKSVDAKMFYKKGNKSCPICCSETNEIVKYKNINKDKYSKEIFYECTSCKSQFELEYLRLYRAVERSNSLQNKLAPTLRVLRIISAVIALLMFVLILLGYE